MSVAARRLVLLGSRARVGVRHAHAMREECRAELNQSIGTLACLAPLRRKQRLCREPPLKLRHHVRALPNDGFVVVKFDREARYYDVIYSDGVLRGDAAPVDRHS